MRSVASLLFLSTLALAGCQSKAEKVEKLLARYNTEYPTYAKDLDETSGSARMLTGEKLTADETAELEGKKKNGTRGASERPTVFERCREKFLPHSSNAVLL
jgi:hypothetical protein